MSQLYCGVMTGTSLDGLDAVLADFSSPIPRIVASASVDYPSTLKTEMLSLQAGSDGLGVNELHRSAVAAAQLTQLHCEAIEQVFSNAQVVPAQVKAIGVHGQTVRHAPNAALPYTVQLIDAPRIAEATGCAVVSDFRSRDIAAGGQGAPLVPAFHAALCANLTQPIAVLNIGGFANLSVLQPGGEIAGFDTGPGNVLMDAWTLRHRAQPYDAGGAWAASGQVDTDLLTRLLAHPYFSQALPKSTGREAFDLNWLDQCTAGLSVSATTVQATLCALTVNTVVQALAQHQPSCQGLYVCGGGAFNHHLMAGLQTQLSCPVRSSDALGVAPQHMEALAFAWLARQCMLGLPGNVPSVTGAFGPRVLGCITPA